MKRSTKEGRERERMSAGRNFIDRDERVDSSRALEEEGDERVEGRMRTVRVVNCGLIFETEVKIEWPSSPRPKTRMFLGGDMSYS